MSTKDRAIPPEVLSFITEARALTQRSLTFPDYVDAILSARPELNDTAPTDTAVDMINAGYIRNTPPKEVADKIVEARAVEVPPGVAVH